MLWEPIGRDEVSKAMSEFRPSNDAPPFVVARCNGVHDRTLLGLLFFSLIRAGEALAGDHAAITRAAADPMIAESRQPSPAATAAVTNLEFFTVPKTTDVKIYSPTDFRPRKPTVFDRDPAVSTLGDAQLLHGTTVWQRLSEYRSHDRVRLLTLWESSGSAVSLQAGKRGEPSLQWNSRLMNHDGSTRGLLDRLFSVSLSGAGNGLRNSTRTTGAPAAPKPVGNPAVAVLK